MDKRRRAYPTRASGPPRSIREGLPRSREPALLTSEGKRLGAVLCTALVSRSRRRDGGDGAKAACPKRTSGDGAWAAPNRCQRLPGSAYSPGIPWVGAFCCGGCSP